MVSRNVLPVLAGVVELEELFATDDTTIFGLAPAEGPATLLSVLLHSSPVGTTFQTIITFY